ncbi:peptidoglycan endopeptidase [Bacillus sp. UMB0899]|nr:peptidoglycan endopeptidase [Bacillus sp. UMB0899]
MKKHVILAFTTIGILTIGISNQASAHEKTYQVQTGDSLWKIASSHHLTVEQIMQYNQLTSSTIYVGQNLSLLAPHSHEQTASYTVKSGDSLSLIAKIYRISVTELKSMNQLSSDIIYIGQVLTVPNSAATTGETSSSTKMTSESYTVQPGDTLWKIALSAGLSVTQLKAINNLSTDTIKVGQVLYLTEKQITQPSFNADKLITEAKKYIGVPYVWAGNTPSGFDCSGYLKYVFQTQGVTIPRTVATIWDATTPVTSPAKGDLVFYATTAKSPTHAGIYIGDNKFIHAGSSTGVTITDMNNSYWKPRYLGARKVKM